MSRLPPSVDAPALLEDGDDRRFRQMVYDLLHLEAVMRRARDRFGAAIGVSGPAYSILMTIAEAPPDAGMRVTGVAERQHVSGAFVTREASRLVSAGLLEKRPDPEDGRAVRLFLTDKGWSGLETLGPLVRSVNGHMFGHLSAEDFDRLCTLSARIGERGGELSIDGLGALTAAAE